MMKYTLTDTFEYNIVYVYTIPDDAHQGRLKIGETMLKLDKFDFLSENTIKEKIRLAAKKRIDEQTKTADVEYQLLHCELAITKNKNVFRDYDVHNVLRRSGYERKSIRKGPRDWFEVNLDIALAAINAAKAEQNCLPHIKGIPMNTVFPFRDSQLDAIKQTVKRFGRTSQSSFLWNAKMRFGKTTAAMQVAKEMQFAKTLIITHRPAVQDGWFDDFKKIFADTDCQFGSKTKGEKLSALIRQNKPFIYFASIQDLRLSKAVVKDSDSHAEGFDKNNDVFKTHWDFLIVDEAHEGTQSALGSVLDEKINRQYTLLLSGTPFNLLDKREADEVYTWDYVMEQEAKEQWETIHPSEPNPYAALPQLSMFTYELNKYIEQPDFQDIEDKAFNFKEFFRVNEEGNLIHEQFVRRFLDLLTKESNSQFPYSTEEYRSFIKHSLWFVPGVKEAKALAELLRNHPVFSAFGIANVAGNEEIDKDALHTVREIIDKHDYSITISCGKLTLGVNVPEWTAVLMLSNTKSATTYLQTAFRCQTPANINGKMKTQCYIFDFAPDRTLQIVAEAAELRTKAGDTNRIEQKEYMERFLNFCPVIAATKGAMNPYDVRGMLQELKKAAIARVVRNGFDDKRIYNDNLFKTTQTDLNDFEDLKAILGASNLDKPTSQLVVNQLGFDDEEYEHAQEKERKPKKELTDEEKERLERLKKLREQAEAMRSILRGISVRMPMLLFGADVLSPDIPITLEKFIELVDDQSWLEYMPTGVTKELFRKFIKYYDEDVFIGAGINIRKKVLACDAMMPLERCETIAEIFATFKNPDKETVLTPWKTVNAHLSGTLGGADFNERVEGIPVWRDVGVGIWNLGIGIGDLGQGIEKENSLAAAPQSHIPTPQSPSLNPQPQIPNHEQFQIVSRPSSLAEIHRPDREDILLYAALSERGNLRHCFANEKSSSVDSEQYSRGTRTQHDGGISPISGEFQRFVMRIGDTVDRLEQSGLSLQGNARKFIERLRSDRQVAQWITEVFEKGLEIRDLGDGNLRIGIGDLGQGIEKENSLAAAPQSQIPAPKSLIPIPKVLEINSKSGLYPLLAAYNFYKPAMEKAITVHRRVEEQLFRQLWSGILSNNIYVICKTPMAASITKRTLSGFTGAKVNVVHIPLVPPAGSQGTALIADPNFDLQTTITKAFGVRDQGIGIRKDGSPTPQSLSPDSKSLASNPQSLTMQFDIIIGNPPYQQADGGGVGSSAVPLYHHFVQQAKKLSPRYISLITPARWYTGGRGLDNFRNEMLHDDRIRVLHDYPKSRDCFPNVEIKGGVCFFLWDRDKRGLCNVVTHRGDEITDKMMRPLLEEGCITFIRSSQAISLFRRVKVFDEPSFSTIVSPNDPFGFDVRETNSYRRVKPIFASKPFKNSIAFYYNGWRQEGIGYIDRKNVSKNFELVDKHKILIPKAWGIGDVSCDWLTPFVADDHSCCTETYLVVGPFNDPKEMNNVLSYMQTKFFHFFVSLMKISQNTMQKAYTFVPMQYFGESWTDTKLYAKYGLTESEITFIEKTIQGRD